MIVIAIIAFLAAITIPILNSVRATANEAAAIATLKAILAGEQIYYTTVGSFASTEVLRQVNPPYVDPNFIFQEQYGGINKDTYSGVGPV